MFKGLFVFLIASLVFTTPETSQADTLSGSSRHIQIVTESDGESTLSGAHYLLSLINSADSPLDIMFGFGAVFVDLPSQNESFAALHAITGLNYKFSRYASFTAEFGFDLGEEILSGDDRGTPTLNGEQTNQIDYSFSAGLSFNLSNSTYLSVYARHHYFDGIFLEPTRVDFLGLRLGFLY